MTVRKGAPRDAVAALAIWRAAVDATHGFLSRQHRAELDGIVAGFLPEADLWVAEDEGRPVGFLIVEGAMIEALFVHPQAHGRGFGTALVEHALGLGPVTTVDANEQADNALPFYEARGFVRIGRSESDGQGWPYPIVHLRHGGA